MEEGVEVRKIITGSSVRSIFINYIFHLHVCSSNEPSTEDISQNECLQWLPTTVQNSFQAIYWIGRLWTVKS